MKNYYKILEVEQTATIEEINSQHKFLLHAWHPDKFPNPDLKVKAEAKLRDINEAYKVLSNTKLRDDYNRSLTNKPSNFNQTSSTNQSPGSTAPNQKTNSKTQNHSTESEAVNRCENCRMPAKTQHVYFHQNIGLIFGRQYKHIEGNLCKHCIDLYFWNFTGTTMLLGWWGIVSLILTPFLLLNNIWYYIFTLGLEEPLRRTVQKPSLFLTLSAITGFLLAGYMIYQLFATPTPHQAYTPTPTPRPIQTSNQFVFPTNAIPTHSECTKASLITSTMEGKVICIYGVIVRTDSSEGGFNKGPETRIRFGDQSHFFIVTSYLLTYSKGDCISTEGEVLLSSEHVPYIKDDGFIRECEAWMK